MTDNNKVMRECRICGSGAEHPVWLAKDMMYGIDGEFLYFQCVECGCLQIEKVPDNLADYYPDQYYSFGKVSNRKLSEPYPAGVLRRMVRIIGTSRAPLLAALQKRIRFPVHHEWLRRADVRPRSMILDVGCGSGSLLVRMRKEGFINASGIDPFIEEDINYRTGLVIKKAAMDDIPESGHYDFIMLHHSLEHIPDQRNAFDQIARLLKPGGTALVRVPVSSSYAWKHYHMDWIQLDAPRHLFLHSEKSLGTIARKSGLSLIETVYDSLEFQFTSSELCRRGVPVPEHKEIIRDSGRSPFSSGQLDAWKNESRRLNDKREGDMACFYLEKERAIDK